MRVAAVLVALAAASGCAELGVVTDGSSISYGKPNGGKLIDGVKLPESGTGYVTGAIWQARGNRAGTDELVSMIKGVAKRMHRKVKDARLVVADLSGASGGEAHQFHKSHQSGRDVDLLYYVRDAEGKPFEPDVMRTFNGRLLATDGSGVTLDVPRTWLLVKELLTSQEAYVQYIFMYRPIAEKLIDYAQKQKEPDVVIARAQKALKQPGDSAPHNDHMHVRVYCAPNDRQFGCVDIGPLELLAEREAEAQQTVEMIAGAPHATGEDTVASNGDDETVHERTAADVWTEAAARSARSTSDGVMGSSLSLMSAMSPPAH